MPAKTPEDLKQAFETLLDIPNIEIEKVEIDREVNYIVTVGSTEKGTTCHECGRDVDKAHGYDRMMTLRHLSILDRDVYIRIRLPRYRCPYCDGHPTTTQNPSWHERGSSHTRAFEQRILLACVNSTVWDVSMKEGVGYGAVEGIINRHIDTEVDWSKIVVLDIIGLDEISLKKGHKDFVVIVTGRVGNETRILAVLKDRTKATVKEFLLSMPKRLRRKVQAVCSDMYDGFISAAKEVFGKKVRIVVDRFHVAKLYRNGVETLRKRELRRLKNELSSEAYKELEGAMWILRKREDDLTEDERKVRDKLFEYSPQLKEAYTFSNELTAIFDLDIDKRRGKLRLTGWIRRVKSRKLDCFNTFIKTLEKYKDEIGNYFVNHHNSGFVEGLNNKIKVIKRRCYGILNINHLFQRIYLDLSGYSLYA